jgi:hypothetical protein
MAPRWALVVTIAILLTFSGWVVGVNKNLSDDRLARMEKYQSDARWDLLVQHGQDIADIRGSVRRHEAQLETLGQMAIDVRVLRTLVENEAARRKREGAGYGVR